MGAKEFLHKKGVYALDTKKRMKEVIEWMEEYAQEEVKIISSKQPVSGSRPICSGTLRTEIRCNKCNGCIDERTIVRA